MYDGKSQLLIENPINRYLINSPMLPNVKKTRMARSRFTSKTSRRARTRKAIGCQPQPTQFTWSCGCIGPRPLRPRSYRMVRGLCVKPTRKSPAAGARHDDKLQTETPPLFVILGVQVFKRDSRRRGVTGSHVAPADAALFVEIDPSALCRVLI